MTPEPDAVEARPSLWRRLTRGATTTSAEGVEAAPPLDDVSLRALIDNLSDAIYFVDPQGVIRYASPVIASITGRPAASFIGLHYRDVIVADEADQAAANIERAIAGEVVRSERSILDAEGRPRRVRVAIRPVRFGDELAGVVGVMTDIEQLRRSERERARLDRELRAVSACNQALVRAEDETSLLEEICRIICDKADYRLVWVALCNDDAQRSVYPVAVAGLDDGYIEMARPSWSSGVNGQCILCRALRACRTACVQDIEQDESMALWRDEARRRGFRSCIALPLMDDHGSPMGVITLYSGQTEAFTPAEIRLLEEMAGDLSFGLRVLRLREKRRLAELERERLNRELRALSDCNQAILRAVDEPSLLNDVCRIVTEMAGYRMAWVGEPQHDEERSMRVVASAGYVAGYLDQARISWSDCERGRGPTGVAAREGRIVYVQQFAVDAIVAPWREAALTRGYRSSIALPLRSAEGPPNSVLTIYSDRVNPFTSNEIRLLEELADDVAYGLGGLRARASRALAEQEQQRLRQHLEQAQKMEAVGRLAGGVAHDFNNVLGVILGYSELLMAMPDLPPSASSRLSEIRVAGEHAAAFTRQLLAFSRRQVLAPRLLDLNDVVRETERMLRRLLGEHIELRLALSDPLPAVRVDPAQMQQVLLNLCINARDAMPRGGVLTIESGLVELSASDAALRAPLAPGRCLRLSVSDNGCGMEPSVLAHIFEPFFTTKGPDKGTGLGLATVYGIVQQSGGQICAYSEPQRGATFSIYLPVCEGETATPLAAPRDIASLPRGAETVLLVEDSEQLRAMTREILERCGYKVLEAPEPEAALSLVSGFEGPIHLLVSDVVMPRMSGPALAERLRRMLPELRMLFVSGYADHAAVNGGMTPPGVPFLQKPYAVAELARKAREALDAPPPQF